MASKTVCSSVNRVCSIGVLIILLFAAGFSGLGLLSIALTLLVKLSSTLVVAFSKQNSTEQTQNMETLEVKFESFGKEGKEVEEEEDCDGQVDDSMARSPDSLSESECRNPLSTSEDSEVDSCPLDQSPECSDGSISDEESLIEIAIPSGHYIAGHKEEAMYQNFYKKMPDFSPDSIFRGNSLFDLLGEMNEMINEEDNLIEIDISVGSIKCSRFGIEA